jgi:exopolyphosphatase / guanosine-5'-triphosphate,3'-diphosphate pyrophosphatase
VSTGAAAGNVSVAGNLAAAGNVSVAGNLAAAGTAATGAPHAGVDVGSNSVRLLVRAADGSRVTREMIVTRLAAGVDATGHLDDQALARTLETIATYRDLWRHHGVTDRVRIAATSAVRDAEDRARFFDGVRDVAGIDAEVLSGAEEARLAFVGAIGAVEVARPAAVLDIGGGSTELILGDLHDRVVGDVSLQLGCVRLTERHLVHDPPRSEEVAAARAMIAERLDAADEAFEQQGARLHTAASLVAVAGTATTIGALHLGLDAYEEERIHGAVVSAEALAALTERLLAMPSAERARLGPMQPGREDVIHGGALILDEVVTRYGFASVVASEADSLDGLTATLG